MQTAPLLSRFKAFVVDLFIILMPILYITTYLILDGKEDFQQNQIAIFLCSLLFGVILSIFFAKTAQSPGYKAYDLWLVDDITKKNPNFLKLILRYIIFLFSCAFLFGIILAFLRKDRKTLHDLLTKTSVLTKK